MRESPMLLAVLGIAIVAAGVRMISDGIDLIVESVGVVFAENVTAPATEEGIEDAS